MSTGLEAIEDSKASPTTAGRIEAKPTPGAMTDTKQTEEEATVTTTGAAGGAAGAAAGDAEDKKENDANNNADESEVIESDYLDELEPRVTLSGRHNNVFYLQRARRLLRLFEEIKILGASLDISRACLVVELLKKEETGRVLKVETRMHLSTNNGEFGEPQPVIEFVIGRGNYGQYVTGFAQRKIIELFEKQIPMSASSDGSETVNDGTEQKTDKYRVNAEKETYELSEDCVRDLALHKSFWAEKGKAEEAEAYLQSESGKGDGFISLPSFIRYSSILINPRLKHLKFREILHARYDLNVGKLRTNNYDGKNRNTRSNARGAANDNSAPAAAPAAAAPAAAPAVNNPTEEEEDVQDID